MRCMRLDELSSDNASDPARWPFAALELALGLTPPSATSRSSSPCTTSSTSSTVLGRGAAVHAERTDLFVRAPVREHRIREAALLADLLEETRAHATAEHLVDDGQRVAVGIGTAERTGAEHEVRLLQRSLEERDRLRVAGFGRR